MPKAHHFATGSILAPLIWLEFIKLVLGQVPLTPGVGQYCSNYYGGSTGCQVTDGQNGDSTDSLEACYPGNPPSPPECCQWSYGNGCAFTGSFIYNGNGRRGLLNQSTDNGDTTKGRSLLQMMTGSTWSCNPGCVSVASCTPIPHATFTGTANPTTSATGCPFTCNPGYTASGYSCISAATQPATTQPATTKTATTQPATTQPATTQPATTQPATTQPATTQPATTQPATTQPATQPPTTTPSCALYSYNNGTACAPCPACPNGSYRIGCGGATVGTCTQCNNTL